MKTNKKLTNVKRKQSNTINRQNGKKAEGTQNTVHNTQHTHTENTQKALL